MGKIRLEADNVAYAGYTDAEFIPCRTCGAFPRTGGLADWWKFPDDARVADKPLALPGLASQKRVRIQMPDGTIAEMPPPVVQWRIQAQERFVCTNGHENWLETTRAMRVPPPAMKPLPKWRMWPKEARRRLRNAWRALRGEWGDDWD
jgi:hypothetical protein